MDVDNVNITHLQLINITKSVLLIVGRLLKPNYQDMNLNNTTMDAKFNYTARIVFECPCCAHQWRDKEHLYCPNCEVRMLYATRIEGVMGEWVIKGTKEGLKC